MTIPIVHVKGEAAARGEMLGRMSAERIHKTFEFYSRQVFRNSPLQWSEIVGRAERLSRAIGDYSRTYMEELEGISKGAAIDLWKIVLLNARTEVLNAHVAECTAVFDQRTGVLGQTWDWIRQLEDLMLLVHYEFPDGREAITLAEPGMQAKIGLNSDGIGVCLNFLASPIDSVGVPIHTVLRAVLDCRTLDEARDAVARSGMGKASHILVACRSGEALGFEFAAGKLAVIEPRDGYLLHTNHCIAGGLESAELPSTFERFECAAMRLKNGTALDVAAMKELLLDDSGGNQSIQCPYHREEFLGGLELGTCATMIMDLDAATLHYRKGPERGSPFESFRLAAAVGPGNRREASASARTVVGAV